MADVRIDEQGREYFEAEIRYDDSPDKVEVVRVYRGKCIACGRRDFLVPNVKMCGPCTFGEAATAGGNW